MILSENSKCQTGSQEAVPEYESSIKQDWKDILL